MAEYMPDGDTVVSPDFTCGAAVNYESAAGLVGDNEDYAENFGAFWNLSPDIAKEYLQIIYLDSLCFNMDRHTKNYGVLRHPDSGAVISAAPNFDNNIALFSRKIPDDLTRKNDKLISLFLELLEQDSRAFAFAAGFPAPTRDLVYECVKQTGMSVPASTVIAACDFITAGSRLINNYLDTH